MNGLLVMFLFKTSIQFVDFPAMFDDRVIVIVLIEIVLLQYS